MKYLILGGTGTLGRATIRELLRSEKTESVLCVSRDELKQVELKRDFPDERLTCGLGDIRDRESIESFFNDIDTVFHFAALKRIPEMELHPMESLKTNVTGTINAAECAHKAKVKYFIFSSTDKACLPINTYGACKFLSEQIIFSMNKKSQTVFSVYRWGNVLGSRGSVIHDFKKSIESGLPISLTSTDMTRFWIRIEDAVAFMLTTYAVRKSTPKIPQMNAAPLTKIAGAIAQRLGKDSVAFEIVGLRPGEKLHEDIAFIKEEGASINSKNASQFTDQELTELIGQVI